jgi:hypothetical protein
VGAGSGFASAATPPVIRAVNHPILDIREYWVAGKALYDAGRIRVPVLLVSPERSRQSD